MNRFLSIVCFALLATSCGGDSPLAAPTSPTQPPLPVTPRPTPPPAPPRVNGDVYDTASRRVAGATVEILDGPQAGASATTDDAGRFLFMGSFDDTVRFRVSKPGHVSKTQTSRVPCELCQRYIGFQLELELAPIDVSGRYTLSFTADSAACAGIPAIARSRSYNATVARHPTVPWVFDVSISDLSVLHGYEWEGMSISVAGNYVTMFVGNLHGSSGLIEQVSPDAYVGFDGESGASVETSFSTVSMPFDGVIQYCQLPTGSPSPTSSGTYSCLPTQPSATVRCTSKQHTFHLSRR
jgi:Carboxypeptidase regulatory-like domain